MFHLKYYVSFQQRQEKLAQRRISTTKSVKSDTFSHTTLVDEQTYNDKTLPKISVSESIDPDHYINIYEGNDDLAMSVRKVCFNCYAQFFQ